MSKQKALLIKYRSSIFMLLILVGLYFYDKGLGLNVATETVLNFKYMLKILPPILLLIGLLDVWVPKETMIKYMGHDSGIKGIGIALLLGSLAAGPLYAAFPIAAILMKKQARFAYVIFFLGVWSSTKLPLLIFEYTSFGGSFTAIHVGSSLVVSLVGALAIEKIIGHEGQKEIYSTASQMAEV
jgi:uncharacterized membrane protein YraQ (UPF0718 family)